MTKELKKVVVIETPEKQLHLKKVMRNLKRLIKKAKPNMDKIKDVDEFLDGLKNINI